MKPDWKDSPSWARWLAMDSNGTWWWYEERPEQGSTHFHNVVEGSKGMIVIPKQDENWRQSLEWRGTK